MLSKARSTIILQTGMAVLSLWLTACARPVTDIPGAPYGSMQSQVRLETGDILESYVAAQRRLLNTAGPIYLANAPLCPFKTVTPGFAVLSDFDLPTPLRDVAYERAHLNSDAAVQAVYAGTPAWDAGVRADDVLLTMDGKPVRNSANFRARVQKFKVGARVTYGFIRQGQSYTVTLPMLESCNYPISYMVSERDINGWTDGRRIYITQGMVNFTNDRELAVVLGHELAHDVMNHIEKEKANTAPIYVVGTIIDAGSELVGLNYSTTQAMLNIYTDTFSKHFELEADYVGLYLVARAGGDMSAAAPFWRRMAAEHGLDQVKLPDFEVRTHPDSPERFVVLGQTQKEIEDKIRAGAPLMPNLKTRYPYGKKYFWWQTDHDAEPDDADLNH
jgi:hypothetical protein